ncbi:MAG: 1-deoxy-D-xylulose-5-phosphate reductoisomerase, partial [Lentisphaeria bacterium]|nr:1-deoxy-D-xylulose-5-phosphate reductoisomerase [Lentisphaeria bacterium]
GHGSIIPVDSEHSAIFQCLTGRRADEVASLVLTASGGTFRDASAEEIANATWERALQHPTWNMGPKITVDSASLMNKALEMVEARYLFRVAPEKIEVLLHPQSLIHSMIRMTDGAFMAQMSVPDMRFAIQYAFTYPERIGGDLPQMAFDPAVQLTFALPDRKKFPSLDFAEEAMRCGGTMPAVMNAANEIAVEKYFRGEIAFPQIWSIIEQTMSAHRAAGQDILEEILEADRWARDYAAHSCQ